MCQVLNMSELWLFVNLRKYGSFLSMCWEAIAEGFLIFYDSEYSRFLCMQGLHKILNMCEYG